MDNLSNKNIKITRNASVLESNSINNRKFEFLSKRYYHSSYCKENITPINTTKQKSTVSIGIISTMDIETINYNDLQIPIAISIAYNYNESKLFIIDHKLLADSGSPTLLCRVRNKI